jgi:hypothetical protein
MTGVSSGIKMISSRILEREGWFLGATLTSGGTDASVTFYDSKDEDISGAIEIGYISQDVPYTDDEIHCVYGIYAEVSEGGEYLVKYSV